MIKRYLILLAISLCSTSLCVVNVYAEKFFERNHLALDGYDPVAYFTEHKPVKGSAQFRADFQGSTFQFVSAAHRDAFALNPAKFAPQYGGYCAYGMAKGYKATIDPAAFTIVSEKLYLNYSETIHSRWRLDIPGYVQKADANWPEVRKQTTVRE